MSRYKPSPNVAYSMRTGLTSEDRPRLDGRGFIDSVAAPTIAKLNPSSDFNYVSNIAVPTGSSPSSTSKMGTLSSYKMLGQKIAGFRQSQTDTRNFLVDIELDAIKTATRKKAYKGLADLTSGVADLLISKEEFEEAEKSRKDVETQVEETRREIEERKNKVEQSTSTVDTSDSPSGATGLYKSAYSSSIKDMYESASPMALKLSEGASSFDESLIDIEPDQSFSDIKETSLMPTTRGGRVSLPSNEYNILGGAKKAVKFLGQGFSKRMTKNLESKEKKYNKIVKQLQTASPNRRAQLENQLDRLQVEIESLVYSN